MRSQLTAALVAIVVCTTLTVWPADPALAATAEREWLKPQLSENQVFPVLRSAEGRWLNWRDTFGAPRMRLVDGTWRQTGIHQGIDIFTERGTPIISIGKGKVENVGWTFYSGFRVGVRGDDSRYYFYAHLSEFAPGISSGAEVAAGQMLGRVGSSGYGPEPTQDEFPPHLHFGLQSGKRWVNSEPMLRRLYEHSVSASRTSRDQSRETTRRLQYLKGRLAESAPPARDQLEKEITEAQNKLNTLKTSGTMKL